MIIGLERKPATGVRDLQPRPAGVRQDGPDERPCIGRIEAAAADVTDDRQPLRGRLVDDVAERAGKEVS